MNEIRTLTFLELRSLYGWNRFLHEKEKKAKNRYRLLCVAWGILTLVIFTYVIGLVWGLTALGAANAVPLFLCTIGTVLIFVFGLFTAGNRLFSQKGYDLLASFPLQTRSVVISRFLTMYLEDLSLTMLVLLPGMITYAVLCHPGFAFYGVAVLGTLLLPLLPLTLASLWGTLLLTLTVRLKHRTLIQTLLTVALVLVILFASFSIETFAQTFDAQALELLLQKTQTVLRTWLPVAGWLADALLGIDFWGLLWFALTSFSATFLCVFLATKGFHPISQSLFFVRSKREYRVGELSKHSLYQALYLREAKRYFSSGAYVTNTILGPILGSMLAVVLCFVGVETLQAALPPVLSFRGMIPFAMAAVFCMMPPAGVSVSLEGDRFWIIRSLPISPKAWLDSKILWTLTLMVPFYLVAEGCLFWALRPAFWEGVFLILIPMVFMVFSTVAGLTLDLKFHQFDWEKEVQVVKQSTSALLSGFVGPLTAFLSLGILMLLPQRWNTVGNGVLVLAVGVLSLLLYRKNNRVRMERL